MIDIAWSEFLFIAVLALILIGPKELPLVLRTIGRWVGKARAFARHLQNQLEDLSQDNFYSIQPRVEKTTKDRHCEERSDSGYQEPQAKPQESCQGLLTVTKVALLPLDCRAPYGGSQ
jgi:sec-independent protein translocase protein TatB